MKRAMLALFAALTAFGQPLMAEDLVIYSGRSDKFVKPVVKAFTEETGIKVVLHSAESTALLNKLRLEGARTSADLYISNDAGNLEKGSHYDIFALTPAEIFDRIPVNYRSDDGNWMGLSARARVLVVNTNSKLANKIDSVFDLAKPELKGRIGITNSANESFIAGVTVYMEKIGEEKTLNWLKGLRENSQGQVFAKHSRIVKAVAKGTIDVGLVNHYYIYRHLAKNPDAPIKIIVPDQGADQIGVAWNVAGVAMSKFTKNREAALAFLKFVTSEKGQRIFAEVNREYPTRAGVQAVAKLPAKKGMKVADVAMWNLGHWRDKTIDLIEKAAMQ